jgi:hypothetical protein
MRTRLAPPLDPESPSDPLQTEQSVSGQSRLRGYVRITGLAIAAVVYLVLVARAAQLDAQVGEMDQDLARARFDLIQAKQEFFDSVRAEPGAPAAQPSQTAEDLANAETLQVCGLPRVQPSILQDAAGRGPLAQATAPAAAPPGSGDRLALKPQ